MGLSINDVCECNHDRGFHNNRISGNYNPLLRYNCCLFKSDEGSFCKCVKFIKKRKWNPLPTKVGSFQKTKENGKNKKDG